MRRVTSLICGLAAGVMFSQTAGAADSTKQNPSAEVRFGSLDKDSDGKISLSEASEHDGLFVAFEGLDKNKDGTLTRDEFASYRPSRM
jgi:Ca2+-binding EF-hand superfamily protein